MRWLCNTQIPYTFVSMCAGACEGVVYMYACACFVDAYGGFMYGICICMYCRQMQMNRHMFIHVYIIVHVCIRICIRMYMHVCPTCVRECSCMWRPHVSYMYEYVSCVCWSMSVCVCMHLRAQISVCVRARVHM
jgi:hypothetical protein